MKFFRSSIIAFFCQGAVIFTGSIASTQELPTISGISSGGFMAIQMATIFSGEFSGVGSLAGGFFYCAENHLQKKIIEGQKNLFLGTKNLFLFDQAPQYYTDILNPYSFLNLDKSKWTIPAKFNPIYQAVGVCMMNPQKGRLPDLKALEAQKKINSLTHFKDLKIYLYQGLGDHLIGFDMIAKTKSFFLDNEVRSENIKISSSPGGHNFPTDKERLNDCSQEDIPFVSSCRRDIAQEILQHLTGRVLLKSEFKKELLFMVDQNLDLSNLSRFKKSWLGPSRSLAPYGYLYATTTCLDHPASCGLHVALHGCEMSDSFDQGFDRRYMDQIKKKANVYMRTKAQTLLGSHSEVFIEQRKIKFGALKFASQAGYAEYAEKNNLMILFPQTWITEDSYPYNPKGCWDWFGANNADYATVDGIETSWLMNYIKRVAVDPRSFILKQKRP